MTITWHAHDGHMNKQEKAATYLILGHSSHTCCGDICKGNKWHMSSWWSSSGRERRKYEGSWSWVLPGIFQGQSEWSSFRCGSCTFWCLEPTEVLACILVAGRRKEWKGSREEKRGKEGKGREDRREGSRQGRRQEKKIGVEVGREMGYHNPFI